MGHDVQREAAGALARFGGESGVGRPAQWFRPDEERVCRLEIPGGSRVPGKGRRQLSPERRPELPRGVHGGAKTEEDGLVVEGLETMVVDLSHEKVDRVRADIHSGAYERRSLGEPSPGHGRARLEGYGGTPRLPRRDAFF